MSKRLEEIQNELAISKGFEDFNHLLENTHEMEIIKSYFNKTSIRYAKEVAQASLERASELPQNLYDDEWHLDKLKESITNPDNIVLNV